jgi:hypothetical protein
MEVGARDSIDGCDSKTARDNTLFSCPGLAGNLNCESCGELAFAVEVRALGDGKMTSLAVGGLA